ncbi:hypothetical protein GXB81_11135 [Paraburkholderia sp. Ac-20336]|uniref:hypothetical protein n=1 Tax=Burkholderiaceae TaxID=119060 RepID=UPI0014220CDC|nr:MULTISPECIES: hypothetical protein [Burkholderiaceae]MBN3803602.1 hypothetical protein [Paraburkholderia sp. Ac-20336]NIF50897.1 hypothetical protein [Burkholderia sp. Ax-1724]
MARPTIGIFGALMALGGFLAIRYVQNRRAGQFAAARDLSRWENEGGAVATPRALASEAAVTSGAHGTNGTNGSGQAHGEGDAWPFPRG